MAFPSLFPESSSLASRNVANLKPTNQLVNRSFHRKLGGQSALKCSVGGTPTKNCLSNCLSHVYLGNTKPPWPKEPGEQEHPLCGLCVSAGFTKTQRVQGLGMSAGFSFSEAAEKHRVRVHLLALARHPECVGLELNKQGLAPVLISNWEHRGQGHASQAYDIGRVL